LACGAQNAVNDLKKAFDHIEKHYPPELKELVLFLLSKPSITKSISAVIDMVAPKMAEQFNQSLMYYFLIRQNDILEDELSKELENGRLFRLVCKLGFINERPE
jgi:PAB-dependent poly(A)-specific ribonuclease subunit 3